jgi:hypothetical protein
MTSSSRLERRYRRLLAFYPKRFRRDQQQEMLAVLMAGAAEGQERPRLSECLDLLRSAISMRLRLPSAWEHEHARVMVPVRLVIGIWLVFLTAILYSYGDGGWWGALLVPAAALHFYIVFRLTYARREQPPG